MFAVPGDAASSVTFLRPSVIFTGKSPTLKYLDRVPSYAAPGDGCKALNLSKNIMLIPQPFD